MLIVDLDGCTFNNRQRSHLLPNEQDRHIAANWTEFNSACVGDSPVSHVIEMVKRLALNYGRKITFATSRDEDSRAASQLQLEQHFAGYDYQLLMRPLDDHRPAQQFKVGLLQSLASQFSEETLLIEDNAQTLQLVAQHFPMIKRILVSPSQDCSYC